MGAFWYKNIGFVLVGIMCYMAAAWVAMPVYAQLAVAEIGSLFICAGAIALLKA